MGLTRLRLLGGAVALAAVGGLAIALRTAPGQREQGEIPPHAARAVEALLSCDRLTPGELAADWRRRAWSDGRLEYAKAILGPEGQGEIGVCRLTLAGGRLAALSWRIDDLPVRSGASVTIEQAWQCALEIARSALPAATGADPSAMHVTRGTRPSSERDGYGFQWEDEGGNRLYVEVNAFTGKATRVWLTVAQAPPKHDPAQMDLLRAKALAQVAARLKKQDLPSLDSLSLLYEEETWLGLPPGQQYAWQGVLAVDPIPDEGAPELRTIVAEVVPNEGGVLDLSLVRTPADALRMVRDHHVALGEAIRRLYPRPEGNVGDTEPAPTIDGQAAVLLTSRPPDGYPAWRQYPRYPCIQSSGEAGLRAIQFLEELPCMGVAACADGQWVAYRYASVLTLVHLDTGEAYQMDEEHSALPAPIFMASGKPWVLGPVSTGDGRTSWKLFSPPAGGGGRRLSVRMAESLGEHDVSVCFGPGDEEAAIVTNERGVHGPQYAVSMGRVDASGDIGGRTQVCRGLTVEPRVTWVAAHRLLIDTGQDLELIDLPEMKRSSLAFPSIRDPDTGDELTPVRPVWGTSEGELLFAARAATWPPERGTRIYICGLDGPGLRRLTPLGNDPAQVYRFPDTGALAFELGGKSAPGVDPSHP